MKKQVIIGMMALAITATSATTFAARGGPAKSAREVLQDYAKTIKETVFKGKQVQSLSAQEVQKAQDSLLNQLDLSPMAKSGLKMSISSGEKVAARTESLATIVAAKKMSVEIAKADAAEGQSISAAADATALVLANSMLTGKRSSTTLDSTQAADTTAALQKMETLPEAILTGFSKAERDSYTAVIKKHDEIVNSGKNLSSEDALVQAIMETKGKTKDEALAIVKKLKDCV